MNKTVLIIIVLAVIAGGYFLLQGSSQNQAQPQEEQSQEPRQQAEGGQEINMVSANFFFSPNNLTFVKNEPAKIVFQNTGTHTFTVDELGIDVLISGPFGEVEFTPTKAGIFEYYCAIPGHREAGMFGQLKVE